MILDHVDEEDKNSVTIRDRNKGNRNQTITLFFGEK